MNKKLINFRPIFIFSLTILVATYFATRVFIAQNLKLVMFIVLSVLGLMCVLWFVVKKHRFLAMLSAILILASYPFLNVFVKGERLLVYQEFSNQTVTMTGVIDGSYKELDSGDIRLVINNVQVEYFTDRHKFDGKVYLYVSPENYNLADFRSGTRISVVGKLKMYYYQSDKLSQSLSYLSSNVLGSMSADYSKVSIGEYKPGLRDKINLFVQNRIDNGNLKYPDVAYALLFGDTNAIDVEVKASFQSTGIAHLLAVSGLHVSVIMMLVGFVMKRCKAKPSTTIIISAILLSIYCYLCNFSVSVIRASIMALVMGYATFRGKAYDGLSAISLACLLTLIVSPNTMFSLSFQLSYIAVFSIFCLAPPLSRWLNKRFYNNFSSTLAMDIAVSAGVVAIELHYFGVFPLSSVLTNLILIPIASTSFMILIVGTLVSVVFPFMSFMFVAYDWLMGIVVKFNFWISNLDLVVNASTGGFAIVVMLIVGFVFSDYLFVSKKTKRVIGLSGIAVLLSMLTFI